VYYSPKTENPLKNIFKEKLKYVAARVISATKGGRYTEYDTFEIVSEAWMHRA